MIYLEQQNFDTEGHRNNKEVYFCKCSCSQLLSPESSLFMLIKTQQYTSELFYLKTI